MAAAPPFGRVLSAMVTPMRADGTLDLDAAQRLATHLVDAGHDGLVVSGTTGESPTTSADEKDELLRAVLDAVGDRCTVIAGVGSNDTAKSAENAQLAQKAGAHGALVVTPYYNKPPQAGLVAHFRAIADASDLPVMLYDIPGRSGIAIARETYLAVSEHERIVAVKDARADLALAGELMASTGLAWYSGDDAMNLTHFANGAVGFVGVTSQVAPAAYRRLADAAVAGRYDEALELHRGLGPIVHAVMDVTQGAITAKAALVLQGHLADPAVRLPLVPADEDQTALLRHALTTIPG
ncbi:4-hydroxy-tetrahydrodipicolinate synthase [Terracoccus luteus]|uniref:4-hydroxy-tetrahydrodipicolinate synthase n=1 Tax=Terracoccus luteus TaxID=53356 RepID=A0A495XWU6_9MICO|nr:4-hydroxy-tetrahydrodipicolinate synthase [Terracoccus luteus]MBB2985126.1 4-hydroxy-tetrahydrodipicolinate synthase [Terracoccus luteus]MCP2170778.1 4-hydroxy-tetrahydrodipicolinate synthase [Terracoccus luteus]RKT77615.1 dihydrodipicolinate synthase [Terracoccus luteus]